MDNVLKLVYDNWMLNGFPLPNGRHPIVNQLIIRDSSEAWHIAQTNVQQTISGNIYAFDHSNFWTNAKKHLSREDIVNPAQVEDSSCVYIWPIEIVTTINSVYEPIEMTVDGNTITYTIVDTMSPELLKLVQQGKVKIMINLAHDPLDDGFHLIKIETYFNQYGIKGSDIIFVPGNDLRGERNKYFPECTINIVPSVMMITRQFAAISQDYPSVTSLGYVSDIMREEDLDRNRIRPKVFLCFNRSMRPHRYLMAYYALKLGLLPDSIFSFLNRHGQRVGDIKQMIERYHPDETDSNMYAQTIHDMIPYELDTQHLTQDERQGFSIANNRKDLYNDTYVHITMETRFIYGETPFISEKTWRPIINLQPFIFVGNVHSLKLLQELGFKTFAPFIDESYDDEMNPVIRFNMIYKEIEKIKNLPIEELHNWYYSITDILLHNQKHIDTFASTNPFLEVFEEIKKVYT